MDSTQSIIIKIFQGHIAFSIRHHFSPKQNSPDRKAPDKIGHR